MPDALSITASAIDPGLLALPWSTTLADWPKRDIVYLPKGISRHLVRFSNLSGHVVAIKETTEEMARREYEMLGNLNRLAVPCVERVAVIAGRTDASGESLPAALVTAHLRFSLPYRALFTQVLRPDTATRLVDALAVLLVRLHNVGFFWGDVSLSNTLFRRDAGAFAAYLVDAETGELHDRLSDGQRFHDLEIAEENIVGELHDLAAELEREVVEDPFDFAASVRESYDQLWDELTRDEVFTVQEGHRLEERLRRLNELGFDVEEVELVSDGGNVRLALPTKVVEPGHHRRRLMRLTGLDAQENQARRLLNDVTRYRTWLERAGEKPVSDTAAAGRWLAEVFEPTIAAVPSDLRGRRDAAELFHELLEHRWFLSERAGRDVGMNRAIPSYIDQVLRPAADEKLPL
jgi:tRNA A-37 threonylcarbamoyl transferase component Bud32